LRRSLPFAINDELRRKGRALQFSQVLAKIAKLGRSIGESAADPT